MTNEQLTKEVMEMKAYQEHCKALHESYEQLFKDFREDIKATRDLAENVHLMAQNMQSMQETQSTMKQQLDKITSEEFKNYKERKKFLSQQVMGALLGSFMTFIIGVIAWLIMGYLRFKGGM